MHYRSVSLFLVLITLSLALTPAVCGPVRKDIQKTIQVTRNCIKSTLSHLQDVAGLLPNISCLSLNHTELVDLRQKPFNDTLSSFGCQMWKISKDETMEMSSELLQLSQYTQDLEHRLINQTTHRDCNLPHFEQDMDNYIYVRCLLQLLDQKLSEAKF